MPVLLKNVVFDTARSVLDSKGNTTAPTAYAAGVEAHIRPVSASQFARLPQQALTAQYAATVEWGTDIAEGDILSNIVLYADRVTPWPGNLPLAETGQVPAATVVWRVVFVEPSTPGPLAHTDVYVTRQVASGPTSIQG